MILSTLGAVPFLGYAASFGSLIVFAVVNLSLMRLRQTKPYMDRPFKTPLYPFTPVLGVILSVALLFIPILIGDGNAIDALTSSIGITGIVIVTYYLRMVGRYRTQIALGGIGVGVGVFLIVSSFFDVLVLIPNYVKLFVGIVFLIAGLFNCSVGRKRSVETG